MVTALTILTLVALPSVYTSLEMTSSSSCSYLGQCSQICHASGCSCLEGFKLGTDNKSCIPVETRKILFADIAQLGYLDHFESFQPTVHILYPSNSYTSLDTVGITFDARNKHVYWTDRRSKNVYRTTLDKPGNPEVITDNSRLQSPEGIAFDWITGNVYFKDKVLGEIIVCRNDSRNKCGTILAEPQALRDLALHPNLGLMFWGKDAVLMRAGMDGSNPVPIVTLNIKSPGGIAVDQGNARIYWVDRNLDTVSSSDFNGKDVKLIIPNDENKSNLYLGIDILGDDIYWSELFDGRIEVKKIFLILILNKPNKMSSISFLYIPRPPTNLLEAIVKQFGMIRTTTSQEFLYLALQNNQSYAQIPASTMVTAQIFVFYLPSQSVHLAIAVCVHPKMQVILSGKSVTFRKVS